MAFLFHLDRNAIKIVMALCMYLCVAIHVYFNGPTFLMFVNPDLLLCNKNPITDNHSKTGPDHNVICAKLRTQNITFIPKFIIAPYHLNPILINKKEPFHLIWCMCTNHFSFLSRRYFRLITTPLFSIVNSHN